MCVSKFVVSHASSIDPSLGRSAPYIQRLRVPSESEVVLVCHGQCGSRTVKNPKTKRSTLSFHIEAETTWDQLAVTIISSCKFYSIPKNFEESIIILQLVAVFSCCCQYFPHELGEMKKPRPPPWALQVCRLRRPGWLAMASSPYPLVVSCQGWSNADLCRNGVVHAGKSCLNWGLFKAELDETCSKTTLLLENPWTSLIPQNNFFKCAFVLISEPTRVLWILKKDQTHKTATVASKFMPLGCFALILHTILLAWKHPSFALMWCGHGSNLRIPPQIPW